MPENHGQIKQAIENFMRHESTSVIAIKGRWGTGKTYTWNTLIKKLAAEGKLDRPKYAYVSLFGINSLQSLKTSLFLHADDTQAINKPVSLKSRLKNLKRIVKKLIERLEGNVPYLSGLSSVVEDAAFATVQNYLICLDDFERRSADLSLKDVFGLVSWLREQRNCKIALIFNDNAFSSDDHLEYNKQREKIIDVDLTFDPHPQQCLDIVYPTTDWVSEKVAEYVIKLDLRNIRLLNRIKSFVAEVLEAAGDCIEEIKAQIVMDICLYTWCHYSKDDNPPPLYYVTTYLDHYFRSQVKKEGKELSDDEKRWNSILEGIRYYTTDSLDKVLAKYIENGFLDITTLKRTIQDLRATHSGQALTTEYRNIWRLFHDSLGDDLTELIERFSNFFRQHANTCSLTELNSVVSLFRELGKNQIADQIIEYYFQADPENISRFRTDNALIAISEWDGQLKDLLDEQATTLQPDYSIGGVLDSMIEDNGWDNKQIRYLASQSSGDFLSFFRSAPTERLNAYIGKGLEFTTYSEPSELQRVIGDNVVKALRSIAQDSSLNKLRVQGKLRRYGIELGDDQPD